MTPTPSGNLTEDPLYRQLKKYVIAATGLDYYEDKDAEFARRIERRLESLSLPDCSSYLNVLRDPRHGSSELDALIAEITIGETYFFRHWEHFDVLRATVLPEMIERKQTARSIRIWCAGCANGSEPYSLAILLKREMSVLLAGWDVTILGTDINRHGLACAREGKFEAWAFRSMPEELKRACFSPHGRHWLIAPEFKKNVSFQYHNLTDHHFPSVVNNLFAFDLIICRNVMIYFGPERMQKLIQQLYDSLVPGGWLLVGPSEPNMSFFRSFETVNAPGVTLYRKLAPPATGSSAADLFRIPAMPAVPAPLRIDVQPNPTLADVRAQADRGNWTSAAQICEQLIETDNLNAAGHFHYALIMEQMGKHVEAEKSLRKAIYLDRKSVLAHYYLGLLFQSRSDPRQAARSFENALRLLSERNEADGFSDADGITGGELRTLAEMHLEILRERA